MSACLRVIDSGLLDGRRNVAFDQALVELHDEGRIAPTLRFLRFAPSVLIGRHQALRREVDVDYCEARGIGIARRITGGGALYLDPGQLGWEVVCDRHSLGVATLGEIAAHLCKAAATGLSTLGVPVRFRPRNDLEVEGRKIGGTGGFHLGDTLFFQGTVLIELDRSTMFSALRIPQEKIARHTACLPGERVTDLRSLLPQATPGHADVRAALQSGFETVLGWTFAAAPIGDDERARCDALHDAEIGRDEFVAEIDEAGSGPDQGSATRSSPGGAVTATVKLTRGPHPRIGTVVLSGDFFVSPPRLVLDLEAALRDAAPADVPRLAAAFFVDHPPAMLSVDPGLIAAALLDAIDRAVGIRR